MARFCGMIGYGITEETSPGVYELQSVERLYYGDVTRNNRNWEKGEGLNDDFNVSNLISILADEFAYAHLYAMRYVEYLGTKWKIKSIDVERPRLVLSIGGVYNEVS